MRETVTEYAMISTRPETMDPEDLQRLGFLFDETWSAVAAKFAESDAAATMIARGRLAGIMIELLEQQRLSHSLKRLALGIFHATYPHAAATTKLHEFETDATAQSH